jgi:hypothetical protein
MGRIERGAITPLTRTDVPRSLIAVLQKGMATRRSDRYSSAVDFARALQRIELELGYAPTSIEVPNLIVREPVRDQTADAGDETRVRSVATIDAQGDAPVAPPVDHDETRARSVTTVSPLPAADDHTMLCGAAPAPIADATMLRPVAAPSAPVAPAETQRTATPDAASPGTPVAATHQRDPSERRRLPIAAIVVLAAVVVVVIAVVGSLVLPGIANPKPHATSTSGGGGESAIIANEVPTPVLVSATPNTADTAVTFAWKNPKPQSGDTYRWSLAEQPGEQRPLGTTTVTVKRPSKGARLCIDVYVQRDGQLSPTPLEACNPK